MLIYLVRVRGIYNRRLACPFSITRIGVFSVSKIFLRLTGHIFFPKQSIIVQSIMILCIAVDLIHGAL